jgi:protein TIF31
VLFIFVVNAFSPYNLFFQQQHEKKTYDILAKQLGEEDSRTKDSENWIKTFKMREQQVPFAYCKVK